MSQDPARLARIMERFVVHDRLMAHPGTALCATATDVLGLPGAALMLIGPARRVHPAGVRGEIMEEIEDLQHVHGEGPCLDAHDLRAPVAEPDLAQSGTARWLGFSPPAVDAGARAVFGFPLRVGADSIGALNLCAVQRGPLTDDQHLDALALAEVAVQTLLSVASREESIHAMSDEIFAVDGNQLVVHQATGMVSAQLAITVDDAMVRLRGHAFSTGRRLSDIAADVVARRLRLEP